MNTETKPQPMGVGFLATLLCALPSYTEVEIDFAPLSFGGEMRTCRFMARDLPREGRRFTNLDAGMEAFMTEAYLDDTNAYAVRIPGLNLEVGR